MMPLLIRGQSKDQAAEAALLRLRETGLSNRASHRAGELSGGEQQRVVLARALAGDPKVLLADEPTGNLDHKTGEMILDLLDEVHHTRGLTSVHVTHNLNFARRADRVLELTLGQLTVPAWASSPLAPLPSASLPPATLPSLSALDSSTDSLAPAGERIYDAQGRKHV
jgi:predicted ABC-type transport system involved in lysophospholipase L1 biosynthesis ATPase subunit